MVEERSEVVYDIGYGFSNPCRYLQEVFRGFLRCLGLENQQGKQRDGGGDGGQEGGGGDGGGEGGVGGGIGGVGGEVDDAPATLSPTDDPPIMDPTDEPVSAAGVVRRRPPPRGPISSGGPGQTN